jgi:hypothetical protein
VDRIRETDHVGLRALGSIGCLADHSDLAFHGYSAGMGGGNDPLRDGGAAFAQVVPVSTGGLEGIPAVAFPET